MLTHLSFYKKDIASHLTNFLQNKKPEYSAVTVFGNEVIDILSDYATSGKMARGSLFLASYKLFSNKEITEETLKISSCLELLQSALLIHDDIMDQDDTRRGKKTIHMLYTESAKKSRFLNSSHYGNSMAICIGDIAFFLAFELLNSVKTEPRIKEKLLQKFATEIQSVGLAQMQDMISGSDLTTPSESTIMQLYTYKTARYTFSLPLALSTLLAGEKESVIAILEKFGELCGIIFQIKDDELDLFGDKKEIGKPVGSDIRENKKTIFYFYAMLQATKKQRDILRKNFGKQNLSNADIETVRSIITVSKTRDAIDTLVKKYLLEAEKNIQKLPKNKQIFLKNILLGIVTRTA